LCVKCLPRYGGERKAPRRWSLFWCAKYLYEQLELLRPKLIVSMGYTPFFTLLRRHGVNFTGLEKISLEPYVGNMYPSLDLPAVSSFSAPTFVTYDPVSWNANKRIRKVSRDHFERLRVIFDDIEDGRGIESLLRSREDIQ